MESTVVGQYTNYPDSKVHGTNMGPIWGRQDPGGSHVGPMNFALWEIRQASVKHDNQVSVLFLEPRYRLNNFEKSELFKLHR